MKYILFISFIVFSISAAAQECDRDVLKEKPGTWKAGIPGSVVGVPAPDLKKEKQVTAAIHKMVSTGYSPTGCQILYAQAFGKVPGEGQTFVGDPYYYSMYILRYLCDPNDATRTKYYVDHATPTTVNIVANAYYCNTSLLAANLETDDMRGYLKLKKRPEKRNGFYFLGDEVVGDFHLPNKIKEYRWLITYNDSLPFSYVNRKEYLLIQKKRLEKTMQNSPSDKAWLSQYMRNIDEYLKKPADSLNKIAICMWNEEERFEKFVPEGTYGSFIAIKPDLAYYHKKLPLSTPQFFSVVYKISHGDPVFEENIANIQKAVDFAALRNMLGK